ncbi:MULTISPECIES: Lsr2 family protein [unclassified Nocardia]|uniref:histone-like nucleoid-structuring protein Lsr2 n=1 Tax=unclassified Nocardia TaxID=2637762 RepID=UPI0035D7EA18
MARKVIVEMVDDFDGDSIAEETVLFAVEGVDFEIDLSAANAAKLREVFEQWTPYARKLGRGRAKSTAAAAPKARPAIDREQSRAIRDWARQNGFEVSTRGRVSTEILDAYNKVEK